MPAQKRYKKKPRFIDSERVLSGGPKSEVCPYRDSPGVPAVLSESLCSLGGRLEFLNK